MSFVLCNKDFPSLSTMTMMCIGADLWDFSTWNSLSFLDPKVTVFINFGKFSPSTVKKCCCCCCCYCFFTGFFCDSHDDTSVGVPDVPLVSEAFFIFHLLSYPSQVFLLVYSQMFFFCHLKSAVESL